MQSPAGYVCSNANKPAEPHASLVTPSLVKKGVVAAILVIALFALIITVASAKTIYVADGENQAIQHDVVNASENPLASLFTVEESFSADNATPEHFRPRPYMPSEDEVKILLREEEILDPRSIDEYDNNSEYSVRDVQRENPLTPFSHRLTENIPQPTFELLAYQTASYSPNPLSSNTTYVNLGESIQAAVNAAASGDTIIVRDGLYSENIDVTKTYLTIRSENGSAHVTVEAENSNDDVFYIATDYVNISGFTLKGSTGLYYAAIYLENANHGNISGNTLLLNTEGLILYNSDNNTLSNNTANSNGDYGIYLARSSNNTLTNNTVSNNYIGIMLYPSSTNNTLSNNTASNNPRGIYLVESGNNTLTSNIMVGNEYNFKVDGETLFHFIQDIDETNVVDGKPIYYWVDQHDEEILGDAGFVGVVNSTNITVKNLTPNSV